MTATLDLTVHFDFVCPWCLIGKRHLQTALAQFRAGHPDVAVNITWRSRQLLPDIPVAGAAYQAFYERRLGSQEAVTARRAQVREAGRSAGLEFAFERIELMPNTLLAHQLIDCVREQGSAGQLDDLIEGLFTAYFMDGCNIGDASVLTAIAANAGYSGSEIAASLASPEQRQRFSAKATAEAREDLPGVPYFIFNGRLALSGAQPLAYLLAAMEQAMQQVAQAA